MSAGNEREFIDHLQNKKGKEQAMKCPILEIGWMQTKVGDKGQSSDCLKEECAIFDDKFSQCVGITTAEQLLRIANALNTILEKMPHAGQFTK